MDTQCSISGPIRLSANITIASVGGLHQQLLDRLQQDSPIILNASGVERADAAALQLFCSLFRTAELKGAACRWEAVSAPLQEAAQLLGVDNLLNLKKA